MFYKLYIKIDTSRIALHFMLVQEWISKLTTVLAVSDSYPHWYFGGKCVYSCFRKKILSKTKKC